MNERTPVYMTPEECALFILFQKNYDSIGLMFRAGVFELKKGNAILSFDEKGVLRSIKREIFTYL